MVSPLPTLRPRRIAVVGAGMVGLSTAWFLQEGGVQVTVLERRDVAAGASWGNAGWLTPALTTPLPEPAVLRYGIRALLNADSPLYVPMPPGPRLLRFLAEFARHSTHRRWVAGMRAYGPINKMALKSFDRMVEGGVAATTHEAEPFLACFASLQDRAALLAELEAIQAAGQDVKFEAITAEQVRAGEPALSGAVRAAVRLYGQRFINPPQFMDALAAAVRKRGGEIWTDMKVHQVRDEMAGVTLVDSSKQMHRFDAVVLANGAALSSLASPFGVRQLVQAGRGYSFSVAASRIPNGPVYFPTQRVACTPLASPSGDRLRVAGMMEFRSPQSPLDPRRIRAIVSATAPFLNGADFENRQDEWVGSRPCTPDGLPLVGATSSERVFVAGGHGMWGMALGPATGRLLAHRMLTGDQPPAMAAFNPLR